MFASLVKRVVFLIRQGLNRVHAPCPCLQNKVIFASKLFWHGPPPFTPYFGFLKPVTLHHWNFMVHSGCFRNWLLLLLVTVIAKWRTMNLKISVTLGLTLQSGNISLPTTRIIQAFSWLRILTQLFLDPERDREKCDHPQPKVPTHFLPRINHFPKMNDSLDIHSLQGKTPPPPTRLSSYPVTPTWQSPNSSISVTAPKFMWLTLIY